MAQRQDEETGSETAFSRRIFIHRLSFLGGGVVLLGGACKREAEEPRRRAPGIQRQDLTTAHRTFLPREYEVMAAACERVLPRDEDPGAIEANVPEYIDRMLQSPELAQMREDFIAGTRALDRQSQARFGVGFVKATPAQRDELLTAFKNGAPGGGEAHYYELLVVLTLEGFLGDPSYGGNKDRVGWNLVGFDTSEPPPGYDGQRHLHAHHHGGQ